MMNRHARRAGKLLVASFIAVLGVTGGLAAQDLNMPLPVDSVEFLLAYAPFELPSALTGTRFEGDRTQRVDLVFDSVTTILTKWAPAPRGGEAFNNMPRYEVAAYEVQKLFLDDSEVVVPPTVPRMLPLAWYRTLDDRMSETLNGTQAVLVVLQSFVTFVTDENVYDRERFEADPSYARYWANANLLTYLIRHGDSNIGNLLISSIGSNPRVFAVDNGVAFNSSESDRGTRWRNLLVDRFPSETVARLRSLTKAQVSEALGVLAEWEIRGGEAVRVTPGDNLEPRTGVRKRGDRVQIGLTRQEIDDLWYRLEVFLSGFGSGRYRTF
jgi:hypothetical protein